MAIRVTCNGKQILLLKNVLFETFHETIREVSDELDIIPENDNLERLLNKFDQNLHGGGAVYGDIADYLKNKKDTLLFADLVIKAIELLEKQKAFIPEAFVDLRKFHNEILKYAQTLPE